MRGWTALARVVEQSPTEYKVEWNVPLANKLCIDRAAIVSSLAEGDRTAPAIEWG